MKTEPWAASCVSDLCGQVTWTRQRLYSLVAEAFAAVNPDKPFPKDKVLLVDEGPAS